MVRDRNTDISKAATKDEKMTGGRWRLGSSGGRCVSLTSQSLDVGVEIVNQMEEVGIWRRGVCQNYLASLLAAALLLSLS